MRAFDHAAELDPDAPPSLNRALVLVRWRRFEEAAPLLKGITEVTPNTTAVQRELGWCLHHMGRFDEALSRYDLAASLSVYGKPIEPRSTSTGKKCWLYRGTTYAAMGRLQEALADLSLFAETRQDYPGVLEVAVVPPGRKGSIRVLINRQGEGGRQRRQTLDQTGVRSAGSSHAEGRWQPPLMGTSRHVSGGRDGPW